MYGTATGDSSPAEDYIQYNCLKHAILSGVNQVDTGHSFRRHRSEYIVGLVLRTLVQKYGLDRSEVNVVSKQGWVGNDDHNEVPNAMLVSEIIHSTGLGHDDFVLGGLYCIDPAFLKHSLISSLKKMNLATLDVALVSYPTEVCKGIYGDAKYYNKLAKAFEFYEFAISKGWLKSYGVSGHNSFTGTTKPTSDS